MKVQEAIVRSCCIPLFYVPRRDEKSIYVDGGTLNNYPIRKLYEYLDPGSVFGIKIMTTAEIDKLPIASCNGEIPSNFTDMCMCLISIIRRQALLQYVKKEDWARSILVDIGDISATDFNLSDEQREFLHEQGIRAAREFVEKRNSSILQN